MEVVSATSSPTATVTPTDNDATESMTSSSATSPTRPFQSDAALFKQDAAIAKSPAALSIENYLPLGCISLEADTLDLTTQPTHEWKEIKESLPTGTELLPLWKASWIRIFQAISSNEPTRIIWRIYILPNDVACFSIERKSKPLRKLLEVLLQRIDISSMTWSGEYDAERTRAFDPWASPEECSLFYLFNTLPSPEPSPEVLRDRYARDAARRLLEPHGAVRGLKTRLYPYQQRSTAQMLLKETADQLVLDPRLERRTCPDGQGFYYGPRDLLFMREPRHYDAIKGGILAETMGLGKTPICLALILSTKGFLPSVPPQYATSEPLKRERVGSLTQIAAATATKHSIPWRKYFDEIEAESGEKMEACLKIMEAEIPQYEIPPRVVRSHRYSNITGPSERVRLTGGTIVVVPRNLVHQWRSEIAKHVEEGALQVLFLENPRVFIPPPEELAKFDLVLFSRPRFEAENKGTEEFYESPLKRLHWLRIIIDEGHGFSSFSSHAAIVAQKLVRAERRWVVSGTPAKDLLGVEVHVAEGDEETVQDIRKQSLEQRKGFDAFQEERSGAIQALGSLASHFLQARPWCITDSTGADNAASWADYVFRHDNFRNRTFSCYSACFRRTLQDLVIKTRPEDVERDMRLPPLTHRVVRLQPSFHDKLSANLFVLVFTANAVTSERTDVDYLFHPNSQPHLHRLITNLRQSAFFWTGFRQEAVLASLQITEKYLAKENAKCTPGDRTLLIEAAKAAELALQSASWQALTASDEMGMFIADWPDQNSKLAWAFDGCEAPMLMGLSQTLQAQKHLNGKLSLDDPCSNLKEAALEYAFAEGNSQAQSPNSKDSTMVKLAVPTSGVNDAMGSKRLSVSGVSRTSPKKAAKRNNTTDSPTSPQAAAPTSPKKVKRRLSIGEADIEIAPDSWLGRAKITGTASSKLSYLIDRVMSLYRDEKILIFYDGGHIAYYLSQALDLLHVKHLIYANTLSGEQRSKYIVLFDTDHTHRVLLMDLKQAAHGLNLSSASRVFFVNAVCRPNIEAQAIKRAHRIGQTRPVHVETLILRGTVEEAIHDRAAAMTSHEHLNARAFLEDDSTITRIIQAARVLPISAEERQGDGQMAKLATPQQIFGRPGRGRPKMSELEFELFGDKKESEMRVSKKSRRSTKAKLTPDNQEPIITTAAAMPPPFSQNTQGGSAVTPQLAISSTNNSGSIFGGG